VLKPLRLGDFFVEHLSGFEHNLEKNAPEDDKEQQAKQVMQVQSVASDIVAQKCAPWLQLSKKKKIGASLDSTARGSTDEERMRRQQQPRATWEPLISSLALIPFYGGPPETFGNAHSTSSRKTKLLLVPLLHYFDG
jgi:hypothetical protein